MALKPGIFKQPLMNKFMIKSQKKVTPPIYQKNIHKMALFRSRKTINTEQLSGQRLSLWHRGLGVRIPSSVKNVKSGKTLLKTSKDRVTIGQSVKSVPLSVCLVVLVPNPMSNLESESIAPIASIAFIAFLLLDPQIV